MPPVHTVPCAPPLVETWLDVVVAPEEAVIPDEGRGPELVWPLPAADEARPPEEVAGRDDPGVADDATSPPDDDEASPADRTWQWPSRHWLASTQSPSTLQRAPVRHAVPERAAVRTSSMRGRR
jgi:hypothetical protein